jgi:hypothetical protein
MFIKILAHYIMQMSLMPFNLNVFQHYYITSLELLAYPDLRKGQPDPLGGQPDFVRVTLTLHGVT